MECLTPVKGKDGVLFGLVLLICVKDRDIYISSVKDNREMDFLQTAIEYTMLQALEENVYQKIQIVLENNPTPVDLEIDASLISYKKSIYYGESKFGVSLYENRESVADIFTSPKLHGTVYHLKNGKWANEYRPHEFTTRFEATKDLLGITKPVQYQFFTD